jgi:hypothetical protein
MFLKATNRRNVKIDTIAILNIETNSFWYEPIMNSSRPAKYGMEFFNQSLKDLESFERFVNDRNDEKAIGLCVTAIGNSSAFSAGYHFKLYLQEIYERNDKDTILHWDYFIGKLLDDPDPTLQILLEELANSLFSSPHDWKNACDTLISLFLWSPQDIAWKKRKLTLLADLQKYENNLHIIKDVLSAAERKFLLREIIKKTLNTSQHDFLLMEKSKQAYLLMFYHNHPAECQTIMAQNTEARKKMKEFLSNSDMYEENAALISQFLKPGDREHVIESIVNKLKLSSAAYMLDFLKKIYKNHPTELQECFKKDELIGIKLRHLLSRVENYQDNLYLIKFALAQEHREIVLEKIIRHVIKHFDATLLETIKKNHPTEFEKSMANLEPDLQKNWQMMQSCHDDQSREGFTLKMKHIKEFVNGVGRVSYEGCLLTCAQINDRKKDKYQFNPTVLKPDEFEKYLDIIKNSSTPLTERFIIADSHWNSGEIKIHENNTVEVLFVDPLGSQFFAFSCTDLVRQVSSHFPSAKLYVAETDRQITGRGCSIYAITDTMRLHTTEKYTGKNIFDYVSDHETKSAQTKGFHEVLLPLSFMNTMRSQELFTRYIPAWPEQEQKKAVNKKGETAAVAAKKHFFFNTEGKEHNARIEYDLQKLAKYNAEYLLNHSQAEIDKKTSEFTLDGFRQRMEEKKPKFQRFSVIKPK